MSSPCNDLDRNRRNIEENERSYVVLSMPSDGRDDGRDDGRRGNGGDDRGDDGDDENSGGETAAKRARDAEGSQKEVRSAVKYNVCGCTPGLIYGNTGCQVPGIFNV